MSVLELFALSCAALALLPMLMCWKNLRDFSVPTRPAAAGTQVSILIPARNEASHIVQAVRQAVASTQVAVEVVVLDDNSTDRTAHLVRELAIRDDRIRLETAPALPPGWAGKQHACHLLAQRARFEVLMFVDADVDIAPNAASVAAGLLQSDARLGMVSGFPQQQSVTLAERCAVPWIHILLLGYLPLVWMRRGTSPAFSAACGQWVIARRSAYVEVGGHAATPRSRHDGLSLPRSFRAGGWRTDVFDGTGLARTRMYHDLRSVWDGFGKSAGEGMATAAGYPVWFVLLAAGHLLPWVLVPTGAVLGQGTVLAAGLAGVLANVLQRALLRRHLGNAPGHRWVDASLHPLGAALVLAINGWALARYLMGRPSDWRGRRYTRQELSADAVKAPGR